MHDSQVVELVDGGDIDAGRAGRAVAAVGALAEVGVFRRSRQHARVVLLRFGRRFVGHGVVDVRRLVEARQDASRGGAGERVMDALHGRHRRAERRRLGAEQTPAGIPLHHRKAHALAFAQRVQLGAGGIHAFERVVVGEGECVVEAGRGRQEVEGGVHAEHDGFDLAGQRGSLRHLGRVGGQPDVPDDVGGFERAHVFDELPGHDALVLVDVVDVVDHAQLHVVGAEAREQVLERGTHEIHVARAHVLAVLPGGADVALDDPAVARAGQRSSEVAAHLGSRHPAVEDVDARFLAALDHGAHLGGRFLLHPFSSEADLADFEPRPAQFAVAHTNPSLDSPSRSHAARFRTASWSEL